MLQTVFEENTYKHVLTDVDVASRYKVARSLRTTKSGKVVIVMGAIYKMSGVFKYQKVFQCDNGFKFKSDWRRFFEKADAELRTETAKYTHTHAAFSNELAKQLHKSMGSKELQDLEKVSAIWVKDLNSIAHKINNTKSSIVGMIPKGALKLDIVKQEKSETYLEENVLLEGGLCRFHY